MRGWLIVRDSRESDEYLAPELRFWVENPLAPGLLTRHAMSSDGSLVLLVYPTKARAEQVALREGALTQAVHLSNLSSLGGE